MSLYDDLPPPVADPSPQTFASSISSSSSGGGDKKDHGSGGKDKKETHLAFKYAPIVKKSDLSSGNAAQKATDAHPNAHPNTQPDSGALSASTGDTGPSQSMGTVVTSINSTTTLQGWKTSAKLMAPVHRRGHQTAKKPVLSDAALLQAQSMAQQQQQQQPASSVSAAPTSTEKKTPLWQAAPMALHRPQGPAHKKKQKLGGLAGMLDDEYDPMIPNELEPFKNALRSRYERMLQDERQRQQRHFAPPPHQLAAPVAFSNDGEDRTTDEQDDTHDFFGQSAKNWNERPAYEETSAVMPAPEPVGIHPDRLRLLSPRHDEQYQEEKEHGSYYDEGISSQQVSHDDRTLAGPEDDDLDGEPLDSIQDGIELDAENKNLVGSPLYMKASSYEEDVDLDGMPLDMESIQAAQMRNSHSGKGRANEINEMEVESYDDLDGVPL